MSTPIWESALVAALVAAAISLSTLWWNSRQARLDRQRELFAEAFAAMAEYREFPFIVRRRDSNGTDRSAIHRDLSRVQAELHRYEAMLKVEAPPVAAAYSRLVTETRRVAGAEISKAWDLPAPRDDQGMHVPDVDLSALSSYEIAYLDATKNHLSLRR
ncbi:MAG: hypothetical protein ACR2NT_03810 [Acidimicrobiia bacterium]